MAVLDPTLDRERGFFKTGAEYVVGCDEVGRGALAGPVAVGLSVIDATVRGIPEGLRDSKLVSEKKRDTLEPAARSWSLFSGVGLATPQEIDEIGITRALGLAGRRALEALVVAGVDLEVSVVLLDGSHDWLNPALTRRVRVQTQVKADRDCGSVAAASVIAKVHRDRLMIAAHEERPVYEWAGNKGYGSAGHLAAIAEFGSTDYHRQTWLKTPDVALFELD
ncbi:MAG: ribonuclease HII [Microbacteriaceae bacterium]